MRLQLLLAVSAGVASAWSFGDLAMSRFSQRRAMQSPQMTTALDNRLTLEAPKLPKQATTRWQVHKFGGASLATADLYVQCSDLLRDESARGAADGGSYAPTMAIVSAKGGVTDKLIKVVNAAMEDIEDAKSLLRTVADEQIEVVRQIASDDDTASVEAAIRADEDDILMVIRWVAPRLRHGKWGAAQEATQPRAGPPRRPRAECSRADALAASARADRWRSSRPSPRRRWSWSPATERCGPP